MCRNQLGRRNITDEQKTALIGEAYKAQKMTVGAQIGNENAKKQSDQSGHIVSVRTRKEIADKFSVGEGTVQRAENFVDGLNEADKVSPGIKDAVISGSVRVSKKFFIFARLLRGLNRGRGGNLLSPSGVLKRSDTANTIKTQGQRKHKRGRGD